MENTPTTAAPAHEEAAPDKVAAPTAPSVPPSIADGGTPVEGSALSREELDAMTNDIVASIKTVYDPEIPADIYELGLIYKIDVDDDRNVDVEMTLTAPGCPGGWRNANLGGKCCSERCRRWPRNR